MIRRPLPLPLLALALLAPSGCSRDGEANHEWGAAEEKRPFTVEHEADGTTIVVLEPEALAAAALEMAHPVARTMAREVAAYGALAADPAAVGVVRAPVAGVLAAADPKTWPSVGAQVEAGATVGTLLPRTTPLTTAELADLRVRLASAHADVSALEAERDADRVALERARKLNAQDKGVSDQAVENAASALSAAEARVVATRSGIEELERVLLHGDAPNLPPLPLIAPRAGEWTAVAAQPGESVEAGQEIARAASFAQLLADVRLPVDAAVDAKQAFVPTKARVVASGGGGGGGEGFAATLVGPAPEGDALAATLRLRIADPKGRLRPGMAVTAFLSDDAPPLPVFALPPAALLRTASRDWVYVEVGAGRFARRAVTIARADGDAVLISAGVDAAANVVTAGAMALLSQEQLAAGGGSGE